MNYNQKTFNIKLSLFVLALFSIIMVFGVNYIMISQLRAEVRQQVEYLAKMAKEMSVAVICSGYEAKIVRKVLGSNLEIFTPGIRMPDDNSNDQKRICAPIESIKNGSDKIIMGRSLFSGNIEENLKQVNDSLNI